MRFAHGPGQRQLWNSRCTTVSVPFCVWHETVFWTVYWHQFLIHPMIKIFFLMMIRIKLQFTHKFSCESNPLSKMKRQNQMWANKSRNVIDMKYEIEWFQFHKIQINGTAKQRKVAAINSLVPAIPSLQKQWETQHRGLRVFETLSVAHAYIFLYHRWQGWFTFSRQSYSTQKSLTDSLEEHLTQRDFKCLPASILY